jgi:hypothetical protein
MLALDDNMIKPKRGRVQKPKPREGPLFTREMRRALETANALDDGTAKVTHQMISASAGVSRHTAQRALHILAYAKTINVRIRDDVELDLSPFSEKSKLTLAEAKRIQADRLEKAFVPRVNAEVRRRIDTADDHVRRQLKEVQAKLAALEKVVALKGVFTKQEFRQLQTAVHPDSSASTDVRNRLLDILVKNQIRLVKET